MLLMIIFIRSGAVFKILGIFILYTAVFTIEVRVAKELPKHLNLLQVAQSRLFLFFLFAALFGILFLLFRPKPDMDGFFNSKKDVSVLKIIKFLFPTCCQCPIIGRFFEVYEDPKRPASCRSFLASACDTRRWTCRKHLFFA